jgi:flagellar biogenesis protein FliO
MRRLQVAALLLAATFACLPAWPADAQPGQTADRASLAFKEEGGETSALLMRSLVAMAAIVGITVGVLWLLRRYGVVAPQRPRGSRTLEVVESLRIAPRATLFVVRFGKSRVLVGHAEHGFSVLAREQSPAEPPPS